MSIFARRVKARTSHDLFRVTRKDVLHDLRELAVRLCYEKGEATVDDVREAYGGLPQYINPNIMAAVFTYQTHRPVRYVKSRRSECGHRPIVVWRLK